MRKFVSPAIAAKELCLSISYLRNLVQIAQDWRKGIHYRDVRSPLSIRPSYQYCVEEINKWLNLSPSKRG